MTLLFKGPGLCALAVLATGCASVNPSDSYRAVEHTASQRLGQELLLPGTPAESEAAARRANSLLAQPLSSDSAVQVALLRHRGLQADLAELNLAEASIAQEAGLPNPGFSFARLSRGGETEIERGLHLQLARLLARPWVIELQARQRQQAQAWVAQRVLAHAADTRRAWVHAVAAEEGARYAQRVLQAAEAGAELALRLQQAGNFSALQAAREAQRRSETELARDHARQAASSARERLTRLLGVDGPTAFTLPERLPDLPPEAAALPADALEQRLDVQAARWSAELTAQQLGLTRRTRFINVLELGVQHNSASGAPPQRGWELRVELPLFDWGQARVAQAEARYMQAVHRAARVATDARSELRDAQARARSRWDTARRQRDELAPQRQRIAQQQLLRHNGMLIDVFELLAEARAQVGGVWATMGALRDFWLAQADLELAQLGAQPLADQAAPAALTSTTPPGVH